MEKLAVTVPIVENGTLIYEDQGRRITATVGTLSWHTWLESATTFTFASEEGTFTAHKARAGNQRGGWYWRAYRCQYGRIFRCYLGVSANLTLPYLRATASRLAARVEDTVNKEAAQGSEQEVLLAASSHVPIPLPIVATKCTFPRLPIQHVPRARLITLLERGAASPLTLVSAPAGSGKTTLLTEWARTTQIPVAWLSLEPADSDPVRFLAYVLTALSSLDERSVRETRSMLDADSVPDLKRVISSLVNGLTHYLTIDAALVLDDYHVLEGEAVHTLLLFLLEHLPEHLHLVIGTRVDPPLPLARLRTRGQVSEIRIDALRFVTSETKSFLHEMKLNLADEALSSLEERTEGWIAGVQLAVLALRGRDDHEAFLRGFRGNHRFLLEYLNDEILAHQTPQVRAFLQQTSILERLSGSLCAAVTGENGSQAMLEELRKANLFVTALDETGEWYRYHPLFAEGLRHQLIQQEPAHYQKLCVRASAWYETHEMQLEACEYALQARDFPRSIPLIEQQVSKLIGQAQLPLLQRWIEQLTPDIITASPLLSVASAWTQYVKDGVSEHLKQTLFQLQQRFQQHTTEAEQMKWAEARANLNFMLVVQALDENDTERALALARQAFQMLPENATYLRNLAMLCLRLAQGMAYRLSGDFAAAEQALLEAGTQIYATNYHYLNLIVLGGLADMYETRGELHKSEQIYRQVLPLFGSREEAQPEMTGWISMTYANLFIEWNRLDDAEDSLKLALSSSLSTAHKEFVLECRLIQHRLCLIRGSHDEAQRLLREIEEDLPLMPPSQQIMIASRLTRTRSLLSQDRADEAALWLKTQGLRYDDPFSIDPSKDLPGIGDLIFSEYMILTRVLIAQGRNAPGEAYLTQALTLLDRFRTPSEHAGLTRRLIEILILTALALQAQGKTQDALAMLMKAVSLAETGGFVRLFIDEGEPMTRLLVRLSTHKSTTSAYLRMLLAAASPTSTSEHNENPRLNLSITAPLLSPLSNREREVLTLLAAGASNQDIAARLVIAPNTAKRHVKHILAKLDVANRAQAVTRAHQLHLL